MQESAQGFTTEERAMINRVLDLQSLTVRQVVDPAGLAVTVSAEAPVAEVLASWPGNAAAPACRSGRPRDGQRRIVGLVSLQHAPLSSATWTRATGPSPISCSPRSIWTRTCAWRSPCAACSAAASGWPSCSAATDAKSGIVSLQDILKVVFGEVKTLTWTGTTSSSSALKIAGRAWCWCSLNGFFVAAEFALVKVRDTQLDAVRPARATAGPAWPG